MSFFTLLHFYFYLLTVQPPTVQPVSNKVTGFFNESITIVFIITNDYPRVKRNNITWLFKSLGSDVFKSISPTSPDHLSLTIHNVQLSDRGMYKMSATSEAGTDEGTVTVDVFGKL